MLHQSALLIPNLHCYSSCHCYITLWFLYPSTSQVCKHLTVIVILIVLINLLIVCDCCYNSTTNLSSPCIIDAVIQLVLFPFIDASSLLFPNLQRYDSLYHHSVVIESTTSGMKTFVCRCSCAQINRCIVHMNVTSLFLFLFFFYFIFYFALTRSIS
jgi:hypothetical protein